MFKLQKRKQPLTTVQTKRSNNFFLLKIIPLQRSQLLNFSAYAHTNTDALFSVLGEMRSYFNRLIFIGKSEKRGWINGSYSLKLSCENTQKG